MTPPEFGRSLVSPRLDSMPGSVTFELLDTVRRMKAAGQQVLDLSAGDPSFDTPRPIIDAAEQALRDGYTHYSPSAGLPELRQAIADDLDSRLGVRCAAQQVLVTPSAKFALFASIASVVAAGDEIIIPSPSWVSYRAMVTLAGAKVREVALDGNGGFRITTDVLEAAITSRTKALLVNTPNNPTGRCLDAAEIDAIAIVAMAHDLAVISDEIYERITFPPARHRSLAAHPDLRERTLLVNGFSKAFAMTGWRLGYLVAPLPLFRAALTVHQHTVGCAAAFTQVAGISALQECGDHVTAMVAEYQGRRDILLSGLSGIPGLRAVAPDGALYVFADVSQTPQGSGSAFAQHVLEREGVVVTPGSAFGSGSDAFVRLTYAPDRSVIEEAVGRLVGLSSQG